MTNTLKNTAIAVLTAASFVVGAQSSANAMGGMNALAGLESASVIEKVGFFKKGGRFTNRGAAVIGLGAAVVGGLIANKVVKSRNNDYQRRPYNPPRVIYSPNCHKMRLSGNVKCVRTYKKPAYKPRPYVSAPRPYKPRLVFSQAVFNQQTWLNQIGYNAGVPDGKMGRNTRNAAAGFQLAMGQPATGYLTPAQTALLAQYANAAAARPAYTAQPALPVQTYVQPRMVAPVQVAPVQAYVPQQRQVIAPAPVYTQPVQQVYQQPVQQYVQPAPVMQQQMMHVSATGHVVRR